MPDEHLAFIVLDDWQNYRLYSHPEFLLTFSPWLGLRSFQEEDLAKLVVDFRYRANDRRSQPRRKRTAIKVHIALSQPRLVWTVAFLRPLAYTTIYLQSLASYYLLVSCYLLPCLLAFASDSQETLNTGYRLLSASMQEIAPFPPGKPFVQEMLVCVPC